MRNKIITNIFITIDSVKWFWDLYAKKEDPALKYNCKNRHKGSLPYRNYNAKTQKNIRKLIDNTNKIYYNQNVIKQREILSSYSIFYRELSCGER